MRDARVELEFGDGEYSFRMGWGQLVELQEKCEAGPYVVLQRLANKTFLMNDIAETIRCGLIGGGMEPVPALKLVKTYVRERPGMECLPLALAVLMAGLLGAPDEDNGAKDKSKERDNPGDKGKLPIASLYGNGAIMGFTPKQVNEMTIWQYVSAWEGYVKHHSGEDAKMSKKESDELFDWLESQDFN